MGNYSVWVDIFFQEVAEVAAISAGDIRTDLPAGIEQRVALRADLVENDSSRTGVARLRAARSVNAPVFVNLRLLVGADLSSGTVELGHLRLQIRVLVIAQLPHNVGGQVFCRNFARSNRSQQCLRVGWTGD